MIYYFSATGNCKHVANRIANVIGDRAVSIEEAEYNIGTIYDNVWTALEDEDNINFIKGDLDYWPCTKKYLKNIFLSLTQRRDREYESREIKFQESYWWKTLLWQIFQNFWMSELWGIASMENLDYAKRLGLVVIKMALQKTCQICP